MSEIRHLNQNQAQEECVKMGALEAVYIDTPWADGACFHSVHLAGLCPRCKEPIGFHLTNGGKLSPSKTLRLEHLFSGDIRCQPDAILEQIKSLTGDQKSDFFTTLHDEAVLRNAGFPEEEISKRLNELKAGRKTTS
jgi:hypothetical protein